MSWNSEVLYGTDGTQIPVRAVMDFDHAMIHNGVGFTAANRHNGIAPAGVLDHLLITGDHSIHMRHLNVQASQAPVSLSYYLNPTVSANGTEETIGNNNMASTKTSKCHIYTGPTVTNVGTLIATDLFPNIGGGGNSGTVGTLAGGEWILPPNTSFLIRFTNEDAQSSDVVHHFFWYEPGLIKMHP